MTDSTCPILIGVMACFLVHKSVSFTHYDNQHSDVQTVGKDTPFIRSNASIEWLSNSGCQPRHVHLSFGDTVTDFNVLWVTENECGGCQVKYGTNDRSLDLASPTVYTRFIERNKNGLQHYHLARLKNLTPGTTYFYLPECGAVIHKKRAFRLEVPLLHQDNQTEMELMVFGDMGVYSESIHTIIEEAQSGRYAAIIHAGDIAYDLDDQGGKVGDQFMELIEPAAATLPYMTCPGNHEILRGSFAHYRHRFVMPNSDWPMKVEKMWYSLDIGQVHFISYSTEVFFTNNGRHADAQWKWLTEDLKSANANRNQTPWVVAFGHRPMYCSSIVGDDCFHVYSKVRAGLEDLFYQQNVDIVLQGHEHNYERLWPMYQWEVTGKSYVNPAAPIHIIMGAAGSREGINPFEPGRPPHWSAFRLDEVALHSYGRLRVFNGSHILWQQRSALQHKILDELWIEKTRWVLRDRPPRPRPHAPSYCGPGCIVGLGVACAVTIFVIVKVIINMRRIYKSSYSYSQSSYSPVPIDNTCTETFHDEHILDILPESQSP